MYKNSNIRAIECLNNTFTIYWRVTDWCNYHCQYCINVNTRKSVDIYQSDDHLLTIINGLNRFIIFNKLNDISLVLAGGEVSFYAWPKLLTALTNLKNITIISNFSAPIKNYKSLYTYCAKHNISLSLVLSLHSENKCFNRKLLSLVNWCRANNYKDPTVSLLVNNNFSFELVDSYIKNGIYNIKLVREKSSIDNSLVPIDNRTRLMLNEYNKKLKKLKNSYTYRIVFNDNSNVYVSSISDFLIELDANGLIPNGYFCNSGSKKIWVSPNGDVYKNRCLKTQDFLLGNIISDTIKLDFAPEYCNMYQQNNSLRCGVCGGISLYKNAGGDNNEI